jgi:hypothetical protein
MATVNHYFQSGKTIGRSSEQNLYEELIIESMKIYGVEVYYLPRKPFNPDPILTEDPYNSYEHAYPIEMYMENVSGYDGDDEIITKFGLEIRDQANFVVSRKRWVETVGSTGNSVLSIRPAEGDIIYMPLTKSLFEIRKVDSQTPFFQVGKLFVFRMSCELMQYSNEVFETGVEEIDNLFNQFADPLDNFEMLQENGETLVTESNSLSPIINEAQTTNNDPSAADNDYFTAEADNVLDFSERNPFGEVSK